MIVIMTMTACSAVGKGRHRRQRLPLATSPPDGIMPGTSPAVALWPANNNGYIFARSSGSVWFTTTWGSENGTLQSIGGWFTSSAALISWSGYSSLRLDVFARGQAPSSGSTTRTDGLVGNPSEESSRATGPAVASWGAGRRYVFVTGTDDALYHKSYNGAKWSGWQSLGGKLTSSPAATSPFTVGVIDVFVRGADSAVWWREWNVTVWSSWKSLGEKAATHAGPAVTSFNDLFVPGPEPSALANELLWRDRDLGRL